MKKLFKKNVLIALLLVISLVAFGTFAGCKPNDDSSSEESEESEPSGSVPTGDEVTLTAYIYATEETKAAWIAAVQAFENANENVIVDTVIGTDVAEKLRNDILGGIIPDVVFLPSWDGSGVTNALIADKALADITGLAGLSGDDNSYCRPYGDSKTYIAPVGETVFGVWYNPAVVTEAPADIDALAAYKAAEGKAVLAFAGKDANSLKGLFVSALLSSADKATADKLFAMDAAAWDDANVAAAASKLSAFAADGGVLYDSYQYSQGDVFYAVANGDAAFGVITDMEAARADAVQIATFAAAEDESYSGITADKIKTTELKFLPLGVSYAQLGDLYIPVESENVEEAKKLVSAILSADMSALNGNGAEAAETYSYRTPALSADAPMDYERTIINRLTSVLYGDTSAAAFTSQMKATAEELAAFVIK
ncbi:MAG: hypothetical protein IJC94_04865 [Oscillospiraceae bacterium]|nr:hypothetical protein [Oscillospiraceae bacterium]